MTQNRKRGRNPQEDEVEFMPLSKRINNLHINNFFSENSMCDYAHIAALPESPPSSVQSLDYTAPQYSPTLTATQNPHYFNINKLLFEMYVERLQRGAHQV